MIEVVYPRPDQPVYEPATFLLGQVPPGYALRVDGQVVYVSEAGYFAVPVTLQEGSNTVQLDALAPGANRPEATHRLAIYRVPAVAEPATDPLAILNDFLGPAQDVALLPGDILEVWCLASPGAQVAVSIPGVLDEAQSVPALDEHDPRLDGRVAIFAELHRNRPAWPARGVYAARLSIPYSASPCLNQPIRWTVRRGDQTVMAEAPGRLTIWEAPRAAAVRSDRAVVRLAPVTGARLTPWREGTHVAVEALIQGWARVRLNPLETVWVAEADLRWLDGTPWPPGSLEIIRTHPAEPEQVHVGLVTRGHRPLQVRSDPTRPDTLTVRLYDTVSRCDFIYYHPAEPWVEAIDWQPVTAETMDVGIRLKQRLGGWDYAPVPDGWHVRLKTWPRSLHNVRILIDPGHGGDETGATGPDGLPEKDLNLALSLRLTEALRTAGFQVAMTRETDQAVSLQARAEQAADWDAHVVLSIHHNALPDGRDPLQYQGASTYYYHPFAKPLADRLLDGLCEAGCPRYGVLYDSLHMTRIHQAMAVLLEIGFVTHPDEYARLIHPDFQQAVADHLSSALRDFAESAG